MKAKIHPQYVEATVTCACGNQFKTVSMKPDLHVEVCAKCHPFFTGKQHLMDIQGRVERFNKRYGQGKAEQPAASEAASEAAPTR
ncbi:MAG: 50S ribosomal protein L31 [Chloroflexota bacterium]|jgi:large subunit ribosomal protein L31|nr:50S ribosomal protein L31 [Chloroflexota bacterium]